MQLGIRRIRAAPAFFGEIRQERAHGQKFKQCRARQTAARFDGRNSEKFSNRRFEKKLDDAPRLKSNCSLESFLETRIFNAKNAAESETQRF